ncbi:MAG: ribonuclease P protein subunit [archaeon]
MKEELIGKKADIINDGKTFQGTIVDETKNMLCMETKLGKKWIIKKTSKIIINNKLIDGKKITKRSEDRIKSC